MKLVLLFLTVFLLYSSAWAADIFVDKDNSCPGAGTTGNPYCSIQNAFDNVSAGDTIKIRDGATAYNENAVLTTTGTSGSIITIQPDTGHDPNITRVAGGSVSGAIQLNNVNHVTVKDLKFDGAGLQTSRYAILARNTSGGTMTGIVVDNVRCNNWGGTGANTEHTGCVASSSTTNTFRITMTVKNSSFSGNRHSSIRATTPLNSVIEDNTITGQRCGITSAGYLEASAIKIGTEGSGVTVRNNTISGHENYTNCLSNDPALPVTSTTHIWAGVYCDAGPTGGLVEKNFVSGIDYPKTFTSGGDSAAYFIESRCSDWTVKNNVAWNIGRKGIRNGSSSTADPDRTAYLNNTIHAAEQGIYAPRGDALQIKNNIFAVDSATLVSVYEIGTAVGEASADASGHQINNNIVWPTDSGSTKIGRWGNTTVRNWTDWKTQCSCDAASINDTPSFTDFAGRDLTITDGLAKDAGVTLASVLTDILGISRPQGAAYDCGAYEFQPPQGGGGVVGLKFEGDIVLEGNLVISN